MALGGFLAAGCDGESGTDMGAADMAMKPAADMAMAMASPDLTMGGSADLTMGKTYSGTVVLVDIAGKVPVPMGDAGVVPVPARLYGPLIGFSDGSGKDDFNNRDGLGLGCVANHYDMDKMDNPTPGIEGGKVTITGLKGGKLLNGMTPPAELECSFDKGAYGCVFKGTMTAIDTAAFGGMEQLIDPAKGVKFAGAGGGNFGTFDSGDINAADEYMMIANMGGMEGLRFKEGQDLQIDFFCKGGKVGDAMCGVTALAFSVSFSQAAPQNYGMPTKTSGNITCAALAANGQVKVPKDAINAAIAGDKALKSQRITMVRIGLPSAKMDSKGNTIRFAAGRGQFAITPIN